MRDASSNLEGGVAPSDLIWRASTLALNDDLSYQPACPSDWPYRWVLFGYTPSQAEAFLNESLDDPSGRTSVRATMSCGSDGCLFNPSVEVLEALSDQSRVRVFNTLVQFADNVPAREAFRRRASDGPYSGISGMPEAARPWLDLVEFTVGDLRVISDVNVLCAHVRSETDRIALFRGLHTVPHVVASLRSNTDINRVLRGLDPRDRDAARARIERARRDGEASVPVTDFLPEAMRERVGGFPSASDVNLNCFWTALRFHVLSPEWPVETSEAMHAALPRSHRWVSDGTMYFGDILLFSDASGSAIHAANYLLGSLVLTKNGHGRHQPWRVLWLRDLSVDYPGITGVTVWRRL